MISRDKLAQRIAIERAEYEVQFAGREDGWQPLVPFVRSAALGIAKRSSEPVAGIRVVRGDYGVSMYPRVDWKKLAQQVERIVPSYKPLLEEEQR